MEFFVSGKSSVGFRRIHPLLAELLRALPSTMDSLSETAESRLFPEPTRDAEFGELRSDWKAFVQPGLHEHFRSSKDVVAADLKNLAEEPDEDTFLLAIPVKHFDAWLNVLNQARLTIAAELGFDEKLLASGEPPDLATDQGLAIFRINLYAFMQQCLIEQTE